MLPRIYATCIVVLAFLLAAPVAGAKTVPGGGQSQGSKPAKKKCKRGYHRVKKRHGKSACVKRSTKKPPIKLPRTVRLQAHLSSTVKRNPLNPFQVTYGISASAATEEAGRSATLSEPTPPPDGVLALYNDGVLACAINVGPQLIGDECPVTYQTLGAHRVTTIYTAGSVSATETSIQQIDPIATTTTVGIAYEPTVMVFPDNGSAPPASYYSEGKHAWLIGTVTVSPAVNPSGAVTLSLDGTPFAANITAPLHLPVWGRTPAPGAGVEYAPPCGPEEPIAKIGIEVQPGNVVWSPTAAVETGAVVLHGAFAGNGYAPSEADTALRFTPGSLPNREPPEPYTCLFWF